MRASSIWLLASACGRIAFDPLDGSGDAGLGDDGALDDAVDAASGLVPMRSQCQSTTTTGTPVSVLTATLQNNVLSTDTIVVAIGWNTVGSAVISVTDNGGSVYAVVAGTLQSGAVKQVMYLAASPAPGNETVIAMFTQPVINASLRVCTYARTDQNGGPPSLGAGGNGTFAVAGPITTTIPNSMVLAAVTGTSNAGLDLAYVTAVNTMPLGHVLEERTAANTAGYQVSASFGVNSDWVIQMIALQPL